MISSGTEDFYFSYHILIEWALFASSLHTHTHTHKIKNALQVCHILINLLDYDDNLCRST